MIERYSKEFLVKWSELDPNGHVRHSAYNDYAAQVRVSAFDDFGYGMQKLLSQQIGPVLFREEVKFYRELHMNETIAVDLQVLATRKNASKWSIQHQVFTQNGELSATIVVDGAWLDLNRRKTTIPPEDLQSIVMNYPRAEGFTWIPDKKQ